MLKQIILNYRRVFVLSALLGAIGIYLGIKLPVSLYPQTSKPVVRMNLSFGGLSSTEFIRKYGINIESQLESIKNTGLKLDHVRGEYYASSAIYTVVYDWNTPFNRALKEVQTVVAGIKAFLPKESADSINVWQWGNGGGFLALSFYSSTLSTNELYEALNPILSSDLNQITDAESAVLWNPESQEISVKMIPEKMALYSILPRDIYSVIEKSLPSLTGGQLLSGESEMTFQVLSPLKSVEDLDHIVVSLKDERKIYLKDVARVFISKNEQQNRSFKTNGKDSLILFANPKSGGNVKRMAEDILQLVIEKKSFYPKDVEYKVLVDPSEFIRESVKNLMKDVLLAGTLAVVILFLFIGNFKNVATIALEIPLSMVIAFIVMYFSGMNINLISLGGLALAAGMNVDASVVVLENIFKHQELWLKNNNNIISFEDRLNLIVRAVKEVAVPVLISTATSLIVFIPLTMTTNLTDAVLGDLAKAVVYSHGASCIVALIVVPAIRYYIMKDSIMKIEHAPLENFLVKVENLHQKLVSVFLGNKTVKVLSLILPFVFTALLIYFIIPKLPKEVVGTPDTDWLFVSITAPKSQSQRQIENILQESETKAIQVLKDEYSYTFVQGNGNKNGQLMLRLKDKSQMKKSVERLEGVFKNTPELYFYVGSWNPAELPLPETTHLEVLLHGKDQKLLQEAASRVKYFINNKGEYDRLQTRPNIEYNSSYEFSPYPEIWSQLMQSGEKISLYDIVELTSYSKGSKSPGSVTFGSRFYPINIQFDDPRYANPENLTSYPVKLKDKLIPLSALGSFHQQKSVNEIYRKNSKEQILITANLDKAKEANWENLALTYKNEILKRKKEFIGNSDVQLEVLQSQKELVEALDQVKVSLGISIVLIFLVLWLQFQSVREVLIIMMTVPLGIIGVLVALFVFKSTLSLNSALGVILLNGISVNNSILLVDYVKNLKRKSQNQADIILEACRRRLRPILITSLTTMLGMLPIAMGWGDGGKILQPLGIAVVFGMLFSTTLTLVIIPWLLYREETVVEEAMKLEEQLTGTLIEKLDKNIEAPQWQ